MENNLSKEKRDTVGEGARPATSKNLKLRSIQGTRYSSNKKSGLYSRMKKLNNSAVTHGSASHSRVFAISGNSNQTAIKKPRTRQSAHETTLNRGDSIYEMGNMENYGKSA